MTICESIQKRYIRLSKGQRKVAQFVIDNPNVIATQVASEVGRLAGVSESTVIRFCYAMELSGFSELQQKMREYLVEKEGAIPIIPKTHTLKQQSISFHELMTHDMNDILIAMQTMNDTNFIEAVHMLNKATRIYVLGFRDAAPTAFWLYYQLSALGENVHLIEYDAAKIGADLVEMDQKSVLFIINQQDEQEDVLTVAQLAKRKNVQTIVFSQQPVQKLKKYSTMQFVVESKNPTVKSDVVMYSFLQAFVQCVAQEEAELKKNSCSVNVKSFVQKLIEVS